MNNWRPIIRATRESHNVRAQIEKYKLYGCKQINIFLIIKVLSKIRAWEKTLKYLSEITIYGWIVCYTLCWVWSLKVPIIFLWRFYCSHFKEVPTEGALCSGFLTGGWSGEVKGRDQVPRVWPPTGSFTRWVWPNLTHWSDWINSIQELYGHF